MMFWKALLGLLLGSVGGTLISLYLLAFYNSMLMHFNGSTSGVLDELGWVLMVGLFGGALIGLGLATRE